MSNWYGTLPLRWVAKKIGELFVERREKVADTDFAALSVSKGGIVPQIATVAKSNDGDNRKRVCGGDFVINSRSDRRGSSGVSSMDGSVSLINIVLTLREEHNIGFFHYLLRSHNFIEEYYRNGHGIVADLWTTRYTEMKIICLPIPPREEQDRIVRFLDWKVSQINKLINTKKKQIELLQEQKRAVVNEVLPSTGEQVRFRNLFMLIKGLNITKANLTEIGIPCVNYGQIHSKYGFEVNPDINLLPYVPKSYFETNPKSLMGYGDFVFVDTSEDIAGSGNFTYLNSQTVAFAGYHTIIARPIKPLNHRYVAYYFDSPQFRSQIQQRVNGVKVYSITRTILNSTTVILPTEEEQEIAVRRLDKFCENINIIIEKITAEIYLLREYRTRLISDVVTGKIDMHGVVVPKYEAVAEMSIDSDEETDEPESIQVVEEQEVNEQQPLHVIINAVANNKVSNKVMIFKRLVLSAHILDNICDEPTAGHVKFEKLLYLSEHCAQIPLHSEYKRAAAGPYDSPALHSIDSQLQKIKWFKRQHIEGESRAYSRLEKADGYKQYLNSNFDVGQQAVIDKLIRLFKTAKTIQCEIVATLYGAWNDFLIEGITPTDDEIVNEVLTNWHEEKGRISRDRWLSALNWMREKDIVPVGYGFSTKRISK